MKLIDPEVFIPTNAGENAAWEVFRFLEGHNKQAFTTTYLNAYKKGLPTSLFYQFKSEIEQDSTIKNRGAVFNKKVQDYFKR